MSIFFVMAGGTGGHLFPAQALAQELNRRGHSVHLATDARAQNYGHDFPAEEIHIIPSATPNLRNPVHLVKSSVTILRGVIKARKILKRVKPVAAIGFGGYPTFPPLLAARSLRVPAGLHEQNAVLGRANRALVRLCNALALTFEGTRYAQNVATRTVVTGNPVRDRVLTLTGAPYEMASGDIFKLVVFGGSQGARVFSDLVPEALGLLDADLRRQIKLVQQCRPEDIERVGKAYQAMGLDAELAPFFEDMPALISASHLVIARAGASTIAELGVLGRPALLFPLPGSIDQDQRANARNMEAAGGGWLMDEKTLDAQQLANRLADMVRAPQMLRDAAAAALTLGRPDAVIALADLLEDIGANRQQSGEPS